MALTKRDKIKNERIRLYFDLICGVTSSVISLSGIIYVAILNRITSIEWFIAGLTFWVGYLLISILMISYGLYTHFKEKDFDETKHKKDIRAPIV